MLLQDVHLFAAANSAKQIKETGAMGLQRRIGVQVARPWFDDRQVLDHGRRLSGQHKDSVGQHQCFVDVMRDEDDRLAGLLPDID
jgi:hypothetical protein